MKTLVIGRRGLIGSAIARSVRDRDELFDPEVNVRWDNIDSARNDLRAVIDGFQSFVGDEKWAVFWAAGKGHLGSTFENLRAEEELFGAFVSSMVEWGSTEGLIALMSSAGAIWSAPIHGPITESTNVTGTSPYAISKLHLEGELTSLCNKMGVRGLVARLSSVYGVNQDLYKPQGLISRLCASSILRRPVEIFVPLETTRNYVYADDAAAMMVDVVKNLLGDREAEGNCVVRIFCSRDNHSIASICASIETVSRRKLLLTTRLSQEASRYPLHFRLKTDFSEMTNRLERTTLVAGIADVYQEMLQNFQNGNLAITT